MNEVPCPICHEPGGFHARGPHDEAVRRIPATAQIHLSKRDEQRIANMLAELDYDAEGVAILPDDAKRAVGRVLARSEPFACPNGDFTTTERASLMLHLRNHCSKRMK